MTESWILNDYDAALEQFTAAMAFPAEQDLVKAGCIQYFEFSFELAWKAIKLLSAQLGLEECLSPKACLRQAFAQGWLTEEVVWLNMLEARNGMSHTYDARKALELYDALPAFLVAMKALRDQLRQL